MKLTIYNQKKRGFRRLRAMQSKVCIFDRYYDHHFSKEGAIQDFRRDLIKYVRNQLNVKTLIIDHNIVDKTQLAKHISIDNN